MDVLFAALTQREGPPAATDGPPTSGASRAQHDPAHGSQGEVMSVEPRITGDRLNITAEYGGFRHIAAHPVGGGGSVLVTFDASGVSVMANITHAEAGALGAHLVRLAAEAEASV